MNSLCSRRLASFAVLAVLTVLTGCGSASSDEVAAGPGMTDLAPSYDARPTDEPARPERERATKAEDTAGTKAEDRASSPRPSSPASRSAGKERPAKRDGVRTRPANVAASGPARIADPAGDLSQSLEGAPASADIVAVELSREGSMVEVRTTFAAAVPTRMSGDKGMNVASFYDVNGNGVIDYEVWASLADNGWGTGHLDRREERATFGPSSGIEVAVEGRTLVTRFPVDRVGGAQTFRWSAASEWGSYESMAASTSARDYAPDDGAADFRG